MTPSLTVSSARCTRSFAAAAAISRPFAAAATVRTGVYSDRMELEPPVSWLNTSEGVAGCRCMLTLDSGMFISSAMIMANAVVIPCPTSSRGSSKSTEPSGLTVSVSMSAVGAAARMRMSPRSMMSAGSGGVGMIASAASAGGASVASRPTLMPMTSTGAAIR